MSIPFRASRYRLPVLIPILALAACGTPAGFMVPSAMAQAGGAAVPVDADGKPLEPLAEGAAAAAAAPAELLSREALQTLVGPIALYPDDLLAIVLPASTYPLEIVQAARFLKRHENDDSLKPDESWDESVTALLNYPEVLELMNDDLDWTWRLGEAVVSRQADVIAAVEAFRDRAYAAGNLKSDEYQTVRQDEGVIEIEPVSEEVIYVPYYEPERVVVYQPRPAYYYHPRPYPVYYYPYPHGYNFYANYFWGVTTAFSIGWTTNHLHVFHHSFHGHPYYGRSYYPHWYYRRPSITVHNRWYGDRRSERTRDHYANGDYWRPRRAGGARSGFHRGRSAYYTEVPRTRSTERYAERRSGRAAAGSRQPGADPAVRFRAREGRPAATANERRTPAAAARRSAATAVARPAAERRAALAGARREAVTRTPPRAIDRAANRSDHRSENRAATTTTRRAAAAAPRSETRPASRPAARRSSSPARPPASAPRSPPRPAASAPAGSARAPALSRPSAEPPRASARRPASRSSAPRAERPRESGGNRRVRER